MLKSFLKHRRSHIFLKKKCSNEQSKIKIFWSTHWKKSDETSINRKSYWLSTKHLGVLHWNWNEFEKVQKVVETRRRENHHFKWPFEFYQAQFIFDWEKELSPRWIFEWALCWYFWWFYWTRGWKDFDFWLVLGTHLFQKYTESMMRRHLITPWFQKISVNKLCSKWRSQRDTSISEMVDFFILRTHLKRYPRSVILPFQLDFCCAAFPQLEDVKLFSPTSI